MSTFLVSSWLVLQFFVIYKLTIKFHSHYEFDISATNIAKYVRDISWLPLLVENSTVEGSNYEAQCNETGRTAMAVLSDAYYGTNMFYLGVIPTLGADQTQPPPPDPDTLGWESGSICVSEATIIRRSIFSPHRITADQFNFVYLRLRNIIWYFFVWCSQDLYSWSKMGFTLWYPKKSTYLPSRIDWSRRQDEAYIIKCIDTAYIVVYF